MFRHVIIGAAAMFGLASAANATVEIATTARGLFSNVRVVGQPLTMVGPIASVSGRTSPGYNLSDGAASLAASVGLGTQLGVAVTLGLNSGAIATAASANGTTPIDTTSGSSSSSIANIDIGLIRTVLGIPIPVLTLTAGQAQSITSVSLASQIVTLSGQSTFTNLDLAVAGLPILSLGSNVQVAPNFVVYDAGGLKITLNQQFPSNFNNTRVLITNAIGISFTNYLLDGRSLSGGVVIGQSAVEFIGTDPVPEPVIWAQLLAGLALAGTAARRRRSRA